MADMTSGNEKEKAPAKADAPKILPKEAVKEPVIPEKSAAKAQTGSVNLGTDLSLVAAKANERYWNIVADIVKTSKTYLDNEASSKKPLRKYLLTFFCRFLAFEFAALIALVIINAFTHGISDSVLLTYMSAVFAETLGLILVMVRFSFASKDEVNIIGLLTEIVKSYQILK